MAGRRAAGAMAVGTAPDRRLLAIGLILAAMTLVPLMDGFAKQLSRDYSVLQVAWARYAFHLALVLPYVVWRYRLIGLRPVRPGLQILRGLALCVSTFCFFAGVAVMPIADTLALAFIAPLVVAAASPLVLGEAVSRRQGIAVLVGFTGVLAIVRPGSGTMQLAAFYGLAAGVSYAGYLLVTRKLSGTAPALVTLAYTGLVGMLTVSLAMPFVWRWPPPGDLAMMAGMGIVAAVGHGLITKAYDHAPAALLAPFSYAEIVMATLVGYVWFGDFPDPWTWLGIAVIVASGIYLGLPDPLRRPPTADTAKS